MSYQKKDGRGHARPSFFWYDKDKDVKVCFLVTCVSMSNIVMKLFVVLGEDLIVQPEGDQLIVDEPMSIQSEMTSSDESSVTMTSQPVSMVTSQVPPPQVPRLATVQVTTPSVQ